MDWCDWVSVCVIARSRYVVKLQINKLFCELSSAVVIVIDIVIRQIRHSCGHGHTLPPSSSSHHHRRRPPPDIANNNKPSVHSSTNDIHWIFIAFYIFIFTIKIEYFSQARYKRTYGVVRRSDDDFGQVLRLSYFGCRTERENPEKSGAKRKVRVREWIFILFLSFDRNSWIRILCITRKTTNWFCRILFIAPLKSSSSSQRFQSRHEQNISSVLHLSSTTLIDVFKPIMNPKSRSRTVKTKPNRHTEEEQSKYSKPKFTHNWPSSWSSEMDLYLACECRLAFVMKILCAVWPFVSCTRKKFRHGQQ